MKGGVSHFVLKGSDTLHQESLATLEGSYSMCQCSVISDQGLGVSGKVLGVRY